MRTFVLFGESIAYTASPVIQAAALDELGLPHGYEVRDVSVADFPAALEALRGTDSGANVTVPHKTAAARIVDELSDDARLLRAVNTVVVDGDQLVGHNTDLPALEDEFAALLPGGVRHAVLIGGGGAARAAQEALLRMDAAVTVAQRSDGTLGRIDELVEGADLLVNATPVGTNSDDLPVDPDLLREDLAVYDLVYRPNPSALVRAARQRGATARGGAGMLVGQAWRALSLWLEGDGVRVGAEIAPIMMRALADLVGDDV